MSLWANTRQKLLFSIWLVFLGVLQWKGDKHLWFLLFLFKIFFRTFLASYYLPVTVARVHGKAVIWDLTSNNRHSVSIVSCSVKWLKLQFCPLGSSLLCCISSVICIRLYSKLKQKEKAKLQFPPLLGFELRASPPNHHNMLDYSTPEQISSQILPKDHPSSMKRTEAQCFWGDKKNVYKHKDPITDHSMDITKV